MWRYRFSNVSRGFSGYHEMCWFFLLHGEQVANPCIIYILVLFTSLSGQRIYYTINIVS